MDYYIFGVSSGIGLALTEVLLERGYRVFGFGRNNHIQHENFQFSAIDLSQATQVKHFVFDQPKMDFCVIYNSGILGEVLPVLKQSTENAQNVFQVNYLSAVEIAKKALDSTNCRQIFFISSGAANRPISSWSQYGASKAALNYFVETLQQECQETNRKVVVKSIAPGVVDTPMQEQIRQVNPENFPTVEYFKNLKKEQELSSAEEVARKLLFVSLNPEHLPSVCMSLRDIP